MAKTFRKVYRIMDISTYEYLLQGLKNHNSIAKKNYGNTVLRLIPMKPEYPITILREIRNSSTNLNSCHEKVSSVGYRVDIYAQDEGKITRDIVARTIAQNIDEYLSGIGLNRVSKNENDLIDEQGAFYHIILTYSGNLQENRLRFI
jgi:hypothetical protein